MPKPVPCVTVPVVYKVNVFVVPLLPSTDTAPVNSIPLLDAP